MTVSSKKFLWSPLGEFAEGFLAELAGLGYSPRSCEAHLLLMKHLSRWLAAQGLSTGDLTDEVAARGRQQAKTSIFRIMTLPSLATHWLLPRLPAFLDAHPASTSALSRSALPTATPMISTSPSPTAIRPTAKAWPRGTTTDQPGSRPASEPSDLPG